MNFPARTVREKLGEGEPGAGADALGKGGGRSFGFEHDEALTLGRTVAGLNAYSKGISLDCSSLF
jgi:hypothetical protein